MDLSDIVSVVPPNTIIAV